MASWMWVFSYTPVRFSLPGPIAVTGTSSAVWLVVVQSTRNLLSENATWNGPSSAVCPAPDSLG